MKNKKFIILLLCIVLIMCVISCSNHFAAIMLRSYEDPKDLGLRVDSFSQTETCIVSWDKDECADIYILNRKAKNDSGFKEIYSGTELEYTDKDLDQKKAYIYRLDKKRGNVIFTGTKYGYGVSATIINDTYENNDKKERATLLDTDCICNTYYCPFDGKYSLIDYDWFYIDLKPHKQAQIVIETDSQSTSFYISDEINDPEVVRKDEDYILVNNTDSYQKLYFRVSLNTTGLSDYMEVSYRVKLNNEVSYY